MSSRKIYPDFLLVINPFEYLKPHWQIIMVVFLLIVGGRPAWGVTVPGAGTSLDNLAASMQSGTWAVLTTKGLNNNFITDPSSGHGDLFLNYSNDGEWDPLTRQWYFIGGGHTGAQHKVLMYSADNNSWRSFNSYPTGGAQVNHGYDHNAFDRNRRIIYHRSSGNNGDVWTLNIDSGGSWINIGTCCETPGAYCASDAVAMEFFPDIDRLVIFDQGFGHVRYYNPNNGTWSNGPTWSTAIGDYHNVAKYNPVYKIVIFGGGNNAQRVLYKLSADGTLKRMNNAPVNLGYNDGFLTLDPVTGDYLAISGDGTFRAWNPITDTWRTLSSNFSALIYQNIPSAADAGGYGWPGEVDMWAAAPVNTYGVIMFLTQGSTGYKETAPGAVLLYKHSSSPPPDIIPPSPPTNLRVN